jgi:hypothetical protein
MAEEIKDKTTSQQRGLISLADRTPEEREEIARKGGIASGETKREKKLLSEIYAEVIAEMYGVDCEKGQSSKEVVKTILSRGDSASVSMLKEMRESTEGSNLNINNNSAPVIINVVGVDSASPDPEKTNPDN